MLTRLAVPIPSPAGHLPRAVRALAVALTTWVAPFSFGGPSPSPVPATTVPQEAPPSLEVTLTHPNIYLGDSVVYSVHVMNVEEPPKPVLPPVDGIAVEFKEERRFDRRSTQIMNGRVETVRTFGRTFSYVLTASRAGDLEIPAPRVTVDGVVFEGTPTTLQVVPPRSQELVILHARVERTGRLPLQPFTVTLQIFVKNLPPPYTKRSPTSVMGEPALNVPWAVAPEGLLATRNYSEWLTPLIARPKQDPDGFTINGERRQSTGFFASLDRPELFAFDLGGRPATDADVAGIDRLEGKAHLYHVYELSREFQPRRSGRFRIPATSIKGEFVTGLRSGQAVPETVFDLGGAIDVEVDEPPAEGRPESWSGTVGRDVRVITDLRPARARVGDPMTLTVSVTGFGNLEQLPPLDFAGLPPFADAFRVYDPTVEVKNDLPVFTYSVRAKSADVTEFPAVKMSWYDLRDGAYHETASDPIPVEIDAIKTLSGADIVSNGVQSGQDLARQDGLFGNVSDPSRARDERPALVLHATSWAVSAGIYILLSVMISRGRRLREDPARVRRRGAAERARDRLRTTTSDLPTTGAATAAPALHGTFAGLIADVAGVPEASVTPRDAVHHLEEMGVESGLVQRVRTFLEVCDGLRFGGASTTLGGEAEALLADLISSLSDLGRLR